MDQPLRTPALEGAKSVRAHPSGCLGARKTLRWYYAVEKRWRQRMGVSGEGRERGPVVRRSCSWVRRAVPLVRARAMRARRAYEHWWDWAWRDWMPANWAALGACETGYGRKPGNWRHANASYVSAFGISRREYDADAAYFHQPPWNDVHPPTLRQQLLAAMGHYARFGDGWGCPGP